MTHVEREPRNRTAGEIHASLEKIVADLATDLTREIVVSRRPVPTPTGGTCSW